MVVLAVFSACATVFSVALLLTPLGDGEGPMWGALFLTALAGGVSFFAPGLARDEYKANILERWSNRRWRTQLPAAHL